MFEEIITTTIIGFASFWFLKFCAPKLLKWRELRDQITSTATEFGHFYSIPITGDGILTTKKLYDKVQQKLRKMAGDMMTLSDIPLYKFWVYFKLLPPKRVIKNIKKSLIGWSNTLIKDDWSSIRRELFIEETKRHLDLPNLHKELKEIEKLEHKNTK